MPDIEITAGLKIERSSVRQVQSDINRALRDTTPEVEIDIGKDSSRKFFQTLDEQLRELSVKEIKGERAFQNFLKNVEDNFRINITEITPDEAALRAAEAKVRAAFERAGDAITAREQFKRGEPITAGPRSQKEGGQLSFFPEEQLDELIGDVTDAERKLSGALVEQALLIREIGEKRANAISEEIDTIGQTISTLKRRLESQKKIAREDESLADQVKSTANRLADAQGEAARLQTEQNKNNQSLQKAYETLRKARIKEFDEEVRQAKRQVREEDRAAKEEAKAAREVAKAKEEQAREVRRRVRNQDRDEKRLQEDVSGALDKSILPTQDERKTAEVDRAADELVNAYKERKVLLEQAAEIDRKIANSSAELAQIQANQQEEISSLVAQEKNVLNEKLASLREYKTSAQQAASVIQDSIDVDRRSLQFQLSSLQEDQNNQAIKERISELNQQIATKTAQLGQSLDAIDVASREEAQIRQQAAQEASGQIRQIKQGYADRKSELDGIIEALREERVATEDNVRAASQRVSQAPRRAGNEGDDKFNQLIQERNRLVSWYNDIQRKTVEAEERIAGVQDQLKASVFERVRIEKEAVQEALDNSRKNKQVAQQRISRIESIIQGLQKQASIENDKIEAGQDSLNSFLKLIEINRKITEARGRVGQLENVVAIAAREEADAKNLAIATARQKNNALKEAASQEAQEQKDILSSLEKKRAAIDERVREINQEVGPREQGDDAAFQAKSIRERARFEQEALEQAKRGEEIEAAKAKKARELVSKYQDLISSADKADATEKDLIDAINQRIRSLKVNKDLGGPEGFTGFASGEDFQKRAQSDFNSSDIKRLNTLLDELKVKYAKAQDASEKFSNASKRANRSVRETANSTKKGGSALSEFGKIAFRAVRNLLIWTVASRLIFGTIQALSQAVDTLREVDAQARRLIFFSQPGLLDEQSAGADRFKESINDLDSAFDTFSRQANRTGLEIGQVADTLTTIARVGREVNSSFTDVVFDLVRLEAGALDANTATTQLNAALNQFFGQLNQVDKELGNATGGIAQLTQGQTLAEASTRSFGATIAAVSRESAFNVEQLLDALARTGPQLQQLGLDFVEGTKLLGEASTATGASASRLATAFRQLPTLAIQNAEALERLTGVAVLDDQGQFQGVERVFDILQRAADLPEGPASNILKNLFDRRTVGIGGAIANNISQIREEVGALSTVEGKSKFIRGAINEQFRQNARDLGSVNAAFNELRNSFVKIISTEEIVTFLTEAIKLAEDYIGALGRLASQFNNAFSGFRGLEEGTTVIGLFTDIITNARIVVQSINDVDDVIELLSDKFPFLSASIEQAVRTFGNLRTAFNLFADKKAISGSLTLVGAIADNIISGFVQLIKIAGKFAVELGSKFATGIAYGFEATIGDTFTTIAKRIAQAVVPFFGPLSAVLEYFGFFEDEAKESSGSVVQEFQKAADKFRKLEFNVAVGDAQEEGLKSVEALQRAEEAAAEQRARRARESGRQRQEILKLEDERRKLLNQLSEAEGDVTKTLELKNRLKIIALELEENNLATQSKILGFEDRRLRNQEKLNLLLKAQEDTQAAFARITSNLTDILGDRDIEFDAKINQEELDSQIRFLRKQRRLLLEIPPGLAEADEERIRNELKEVEEELRQARRESANLEIDNFTDKIDESFSKAGELVSRLSDSASRFESAFASAVQAINGVVGTIGQLGNSLLDRVRTSGQRISNFLEQSGASFENRLGAVQRQGQQELRIVRESARAQLSELRRFQRAKPFEGGSQIQQAAQNLIGIIGAASESAFDEVENQQGRSVDLNLQRLRSLESQERQLFSLRLQQTEKAIAIRNDALDKEQEILRTRLQNEKEIRDLRIKQERELGKLFLESQDEFVKTLRNVDVSEQFFSGIGGLDESSIDTLFNRVGGAIQSGNIEALRQVQSGLQAAGQFGFDSPVQGIGSDQLASIFQRAVARAATGRGSEGLIREIEEEIALINEQTELQKRIQESQLEQARLASVSIQIDRARAAIAVNDANIAQEQRKQTIDELKTLNQSMRENILAVITSSNELLSTLPESEQRNLRDAIGEFAVKVSNANKENLDSSNEKVRAALEDSKSLLSEINGKVGQEPEQEVVPRSRNTELSEAARLIGKIDEGIRGLASGGAFRFGGDKGFGGRSFNLSEGGRLDAAREALSDESSRRNIVGQFRNLLSDNIAIDQEPIDQLRDFAEQDSINLKKFREFLNSQGFTGAAADVTTQGQAEQVLDRFIDVADRLAREQGEVSRNTLRELTEIVSRELARNLERDREARTRTLEATNEDRRKSGEQGSARTLEATEEDRRRSEENARNIANIITNANGEIVKKMQESVNNFANVVENFELGFGEPLKITIESAIKSTIENSDELAESISNVLGRPATQEELESIKKGIAALFSIERQRGSDLPVVPQIPEI